MTANLERVGSQPGLQDLGRGCRQFFCVQGGFAANYGDLLIGCHNVVCVGDEPLLDMAGVDLKVKLEGQRVGAALFVVQSESLMFAQLGAGQVGALRGGGG